ncbi:amino acid adenylation domain-containing protein [Wukongibacter sp. M2B1]|uniref:amino acid adenylation domain-containing protein n=1 Tax=Wukongibacter sp. M2B1 TaxID=3088895 RepID=UPI003D78EDE7
MKEKLKIAKVYSLTSLQEGILFHSLEDQNSQAYILQFAFSIKGRLNIELLKESLNILIQRHDVFRTNFIYENIDKPKQVVFEKRVAEVEFFDIGNRKEDKRNLLIEEIKEEDRRRGFNLLKDILIRMSLIKIDKEMYTVILSIHHIILDGWCIGLISKELFEIYSSLTRHERPEDIRIQPFSTYIKWLQGQDHSGAKSYWQDYLKGYEKQAVLPKDFSSKSTSNYRLQEIKYTFDKDVTEGLLRFSADNHVTLNTVFQTLWGILVQRYNNTEDVVFGSVVSGRPPEIDGIETMVGLMINTIPVRIKSKGHKRISQLVKEVQASNLKSKEYDFFSLAEIQGDSKLKNKLIDHIIIFENYPISKEMEKIGKECDLGFAISNVEGFEQTNYDFNIMVYLKNNLTLKLCYNAEAYDRTSVNRVINHFKKLVEYINCNNNIALEDIEIITEEEKNIYELSNKTEMKYEDHKTIHELFQNQVEKTPDDIAVVFEDREMTYRELDIKSNQLAKKLRDIGIVPGCIVGIMMTRTIEMLIAMLGVLKAGGAYLPIDPSLPIERIDFILGDSNATALLVNEYLVEDITFTGEILEINDKKLSSIDAPFVPNVNTPRDLAYLIYTSGSTGKPKGVMIEHRSVNNFIQGMGAKIEFLQKRIIAALTTISFDISFLEILLPLTKGMRVVVASEECQKDPEKIRELIIQNRVDMIQVTPSRLQLLLNSEDKRYLGMLKDIIIGGEMLPKNLSNQLKKYTEARIFNAYGPTETTIWSAVKELTYSKDITIGTPIANTKIHILDKNLKRQPVGIYGELCIGGDGLARGYLDRKLTDVKFVNVSCLNNELVYRTGDMARWLPDGELEFFGRIDNQVKVRGYRIELGDIEAQLQSFEGIKEAAAIVKEDKDLDKYICAYFVSEGEIQVKDLRKYLSKKLPKYMIPAFMTQIQHMPLTASGKIDRLTLSTMKHGPITDKTAQMPSNKLQKALAGIWKDVLGIDSVDINSSFWEVGGHSLKAIILVSKIKKIFNIKISIKDIFEISTIKEMEEYIKNANRISYSSIQAIAQRPYYKVSASQKRLFILNSIDGEKTAYNMPYAVIIRGVLDRDGLNEAFEKLVKRHEILRSRFELENGKPVMKIQEGSEFRLDYEEYDNEIDRSQIDSFIRAFVSPFDLRKGGLLRAKLIKLGELKYLLMYDMHHIISDGTSANIFARELIELYGNKELPDLRIQYKDFAHWQNELFNKDEILKQEKYWLKRFSNELPLLNMPTDFIRPMQQSFEGDRVRFILSKNLTEGLKSIAKHAGATMYMILLAIYNVLLSKYTGQSDIIVGTPVAGRRHDDLENMIGVFINTLAMRNFPTSIKTFTDFLSEVKKNSIEAFENQDYQFEELIDKLNLKRDAARNPLFDTILVIQNMNDYSSTVDGVSFEPYEFKNKISKFDFSLWGSENNGGFEFELEYCTKLFRKESILRMVNHFLNIIEQIVNTPEIAISDIELMTEEERKHIIFDFNDTKAMLDKPWTIHQMFEDQVEKSPDNIALSYKSTKITYRELNSKANQLGRKLREKGVEPGTLVSVMTNRGPEMIIGILAVLKAGGAYVPVDIEYPSDRIKYILEDSKSKVILTKGDIGYQALNDAELVYLDDEELYRYNDGNLENTSSKDDMSYMIYTSGSTGKPKGVMINHKAVINFVKGVSDQIEFLANRTILALTTISFDIFVLETILPLLRGLKIVIADENEQLDSKLLSQLIDYNKVDMVQVTPSRLQMLIENEEHSQVLKKVKTIMVGGEAFPRSLLEKLKQITDADIYNMYGPTETTVWSTIKNLTKETDINIGKPILNTQVYILDNKLKLQPIGVVGELYITGEGLAKGYYNKPELTRERFLDIPFGKGERMYKTGDLARWLSNGDIEYIGRSDYQVKIRGYRIEIQEIETNLKTLDMITNCVVVPKQNEAGHKFLAAYYVSDEKMKVEDIREHLAAKLPIYMIPEVYYHLDKLPMTPNGKIDRESLPEHELYRPKTKEAYVAPETDIEKKLLEIWLGVLNCDVIGVNDNFFSLGGNSLLLIQMHSEVEKIYPEVVAIAKLFVYSTIRKLAQYISERIELIKEDDIERPSFPVMPAEYFNYAQSSEMNMGLKFEIRDQLYSTINNISKSNNIEDYEILQSIFLYMLAKLSKQKTITVSSLSRDRAEIFYFNIDFSDIKDFKTLYKRVNHLNKDNISNRVQYKKLLDMNKAWNRNQIIPLVYSGVALESTKTNEFDIVLRMVKEEDSIKCYFQYVSGKFKNTKMREMFTNYRQLVVNILNR